ncbi:RDD family protein [Bailinhaonella thermotolerans]|uniref:RDD family protein n=1 Tax=Bailinhaonella thermotolerans TaxID=1070861 RepID=UPI001F5B16F5|nr:RDD family protein [Bailinhaonella thermotolerans]
MSDVVTGEAVVVDVRVAGLATRALSQLIDVVAQIAALYALSLILGLVANVTDEAFFFVIQLVFSILVIVAYPVAFETLSRGRTLGKLALGLRVVGDDGSPVRFRQALVRGLATLVEIWAFWGSPALITSLVNRRGKRLGDVFAGTIVISDRMSLRAEPPPPMPPALASWAGTLELSGLSNDLANTARQYLTRWHELSPLTREEMGARVASAVAERVSPPPPPGVPPHAYLSAVLAERRRRAEHRLALQERRRLQRRAQAPLPRYGLPAPTPPAPYGSAPGGPAPYGSAPGGPAPYGSAPAGPAPYGSAPGVPYGPPPAPHTPASTPYGSAPQSAAGLTPYGSAPAPAGPAPGGPAAAGPAGGGPGFAAGPQGPGHARP